VDPVLQRALDDARTGNLARALALVRKFVAVKPSSTDALQVLGLLLAQSGQFEQAAAHLARAVDLAPRVPNLRNNYASALIQLRRYAEAVSEAQQAIQLDAGYIPGYITLSCALLYQPDSQAAAEAARRGLAVAPASVDLAKNLILALGQSGRLEEALHAAEEAHRLHPHAAELHSLLLMHLNYIDRSAADTAVAHARFGELHPSSTGPAGDLDPDRTLRIGFLSADLRTHSVAYFLEPLLEHQPRDVETCGFSLQQTPTDPMTRRLQALVQAWDQVGHLDDAALAGRIRERRIDILFDLMGHTGGGRLSALALKPAPLLMTAIGYPNTTGLAAIDYRLVDSITDPPGAELLSTERLLRIEPCFLCYKPPRDAPDPVMPRQAAVTFGSFNAPAKISERTASLWASVLRAVAQSRLVLKSKDLTEACARAAVMDRLSRAGISADQVSFLPATPSVRDHLELYSSVHIALDTVPYNGTTTTCEALYMGVPVVTMPGDRHAARVGASLLNAAGCSRWIAGSPEEFVQVCAALAADRAALESIRSGLRPSLLASALCDSASYSARVYAALRACWRERCAAG
jgi:protein O-GlcNAc transferase